MLLIYISFINTAFPHNPLVVGSSPTGPTIFCYKSAAYQNTTAYNLLTQCLHTVSAANSN